MTIMQLLVAALLALVVFFYPSIVTSIVNAFIKVIPYGHGCIKTRFGKFVSKHESGVVFVVPVIHKLIRLPLEFIQRIPIEASVQTKSGDSLDISFPLKYIKDFKLLEKYYYAMSDGQEKFEAMVGDAIVTLVNTLTGANELEEIYQKKEALWLAINCLVRLSIMPHINPIKYGIEEASPDCSKTLGFYETHRKEIIKALDEEEGNPEDHSQIENRFGIDVKTVDVCNFVFSPETQKAINQKKRDQALAEAAKFRFELIERHKALGLLPKDAVQHTEVALSQTTGNDIHNISFSGLDLKGLIQVNLSNPGGK